MSKATHISTCRIEDRDKSGKKSVIPANKELTLTAAQAKKYGPAVRAIEQEEAAAEDGTDTVEGGGDE